MDVVMGTHAVEEMLSPLHSWAIQSRTGRQHGTYHPIGKDNRVPFIRERPVTDSRLGALRHRMAPPALQSLRDGGTP
jgi:hypothetical protein